jgi:amidohydrolase
MTERLVAPAGLAEIYKDLHAHPELSFAETRTAGLVADRLRALGYATAGEVGGTGVVGVLANGPGPAVMLRADMDALPVLEDTGLDYASNRRAVDEHGADVPLMHACGHDMHVACLLGAAERLAATTTEWSGTVMLVFQPAEEIGQGARAMIDAGLVERFGRPDVVLGQHVAPLPAGMVSLRSGTAFAASDSLRITMFGQGAHGSRPETSIDPVVMAAATVLRLQTIVSREVGGAETAVLTVGSMHAGTRGNIIPDEAEILLNLRTFDDNVRDRVLAGVERVAKAEAAASGAVRDPEIEHLHCSPVVVNDSDAAARTKAAFDAVLGSGSVVDLGPATGSEDVGLLAKAADAPIVYWLLGGADPALFADTSSVDAIADGMLMIPSNHSPFYAPVIEPTLSTGVTALVTAASAWLEPVRG